MSTHSTPNMNPSNPRKRRRLNNNLATNDRMQVMVGVEKRKVEKLRKELSQTRASKDKVLRELGQIKSDTLSQIESKNKEISNLQEKLQYLHREGKQHKQSQDTLSHKIEILEAQIKSLQRENFNLRSKAFHKSKTKKDSNDHSLSNGHITPNGPTSNGSTPDGYTPDGSTHSIHNTKDKMECIKLRNELQIKEVTIQSQNDEIMRLQQQLDHIEAVNLSNSESLDTASKHIERLQHQIKEKTARQSDLVESGLFLTEFSISC